MREFTLGRQYSRQDISAEIGGNTQQYLPTKNKKVICACIKEEMNLPPNIILVGVRPRTIETAGMLAEQGEKGESVPLFQQNGPARWEYKGQFQAVDYILAEDQPALIEKYRKQAGRTSPVTGAIKITRTSD
jgi:hypothetical protein